MIERCKRILLRELIFFHLPYNVSLVPKPLVDLSSGEFDLLGQLDDFLLGPLVRPVFEVAFEHEDLAGGFEALGSH